MVGDGNTKSFANMWEEGLVDQSLYFKPNTASAYSPGERLPEDSEWMKDEENSGVLSEILAKHLTNVMGTVGGAGDEQFPGVVLDPVTVHDTTDSTADTDEFDVSNVKPDSKIDVEVDKYLKKEPKKEMSEKIKTMPPRLFKHYMARLNDINKKAKTGSKRDKNFIKNLPGGDS
jgi:hypothetical protein